MLEKTSEAEQLAVSLPPVPPPPPSKRTGWRWLKSEQSNKLQILWQANLSPIVIWLRWRLVFLFLPIFAFGAFPNGFDLAAGRFPLPGGGIWLDRLVGSWARWDGWWYTQIALNGYQSDLAASYYPAYPLLLRWLTFIFTFGNVTVANVAVVGIIVSTIAALAACILLYQLVALDYNSETARLTVLYLTAFPSAFFLFAVYTEALFLALAIGAFYAARRNRWLLAMLLAALAVVTKNQGVLLVVALAVLYVQQRGWRGRGGWRILYLGLPGAALGGWLLFNALTFGNLTTFLSSNQKYWHRQFMWPWEVLSSAYTITFHDHCNGSCLAFDDKPYLLEYMGVVLFLVLLGVGIWAVWQAKFQLSYLVFFVGSLVQPLSFPQSDDPLGSMLRYEVMIFPAFIMLAWLGNRWKFVHYGYLAASIPLLVLMAARFNLWFWVS